MLTWPGSDFDCGGQSDNQKGNKSTEKIAAITILVIMEVQTAGYGRSQ